MTSSQPVVTRNAINFTPDNKRCYAYSGSVSATNVEAILLEFNTNSEFIIADIQFNSMNELAQECGYQIYLNNLVIMNYLDGNRADPYHSPKSNNMQKILIPPFTIFKSTAKNLTDTASLTKQTCTLVGDVYGMTDTGYQ